MKLDAQTMSEAEAPNGLYEYAGRLKCHIGRPFLRRYVFEVVERSKVQTLLISSGKQHNASALLMMTVERYS